MLAFDGASNAMGHKISFILISPTNGYTPFISSLYFDCTNNMEDLKGVWGLRINHLSSKRIMGNSSS